MCRAMKKSLAMAATCLVSIGLSFAHIPVSFSQQADSIPKTKNLRAAAINGSLTRDSSYAFHYGFCPHLYLIKTGFFCFGHNEYLL